MTELGYLLRLEHVPLWAGIAFVVVLPLVLGATFVYRLVTSFARFRIVWTVIYIVLGLFALPYVAFMVAAANGDAL